MTKKVIFKNAYVSVQVHRWLKLQSAAAGLTMTEYLDHIIKEFRKEKRA